MAATVIVPFSISGATLTLYPSGSDTAASSGVTLTKYTNRSKWHGSVTGLTGLHEAEVWLGSGLVWFGWIKMATSGTIEAKDTEREALDTIGTVTTLTNAPTALTAQITTLANKFSGMTNVGAWMIRLIYKKTGTSALAAHTEIDAKAND